MHRKIDLFLYNRLPHLQQYITNRTYFPRNRQGQIAMSLSIQAEFAEDLRRLREIVMWLDSTAGKGTSRVKNIRFSGRGIHGPHRVLSSYQVIRFLNESFGSLRKLERGTDGTINDPDEDRIWSWNEGGIRLIPDWYLPPPLYSQTFRASLFRGRRLMDIWPFVRLGKQDITIRNLLAIAEVNELIALLVLIPQVVYKEWSESNTRAPSCDRHVGPIASFIDRHWINAFPLVKICIESPGLWIYTATQILRKPFEAPSKSIFGHENTYATLTLNDKG